MNTLIIYSSKYGCTTDCANYLKNGLLGSTTLIDIDQTNPKSIAWENYETIIIGSSIYIGSVSKKIRTTCNENIDLLLKKRVGIYICCAFSEQKTEYFNKNFPPELLENALATMAFGGEARLEKMNTLDKLIMKAATKGQNTSLQISYVYMDEFIKKLG